MKPKTRIQKEIAELSNQLPRLTKKQTAYAYEHCFKHYAHRTKGGLVTCTECGHRWDSEHRLAESICGCICPNCRRDLELLDTRKRVFKDNEYFSLITTCKGYQVIRFFMAKVSRKVGQAADYSINEVVQRWIAPDGRSEVIARLRAMHTMYYDLWTEWSDMELRCNKNLRAYDIIPYKTYPTKRFIPELRRNGFKGNFHKIQSYDLFTAILSDSRKETLLKAGQVGMLRHCIHSSLNLQNYWNSIKICIRNGYTIADASLWCDYIKLLQHFGKDINNAKYVCPTNLKREHDKWMHRKDMEIIRKRKEEQRQKAFENEQKFKELKSRFFGISFTDGTIQVRTLDSVAEYMEEGLTMHHCVFSNEYYLKENTLILSATIDGKHIETIEISLDTLEVIQCRGAYNKQTPYHKQIIQLVNKNVGIIRQRLTA